MPYLALQFSALVVGLLAANRNRMLTYSTGVLVLLAFAAIAGLRGTVGTDTATYISLVSLVMSDAQIAIEPGFLAFIKLASLLTNNPSTVVNLFSAMFFAVMLLFMFRATKLELIYLFSYFAPQYFLLYSMNGIRIGLASAFFLLFFQGWTRGNKLQAILVGAVAISFHFSILLAFVLFFFGRSSRSSHRSLSGQLIVIALLSIGSMALNDYLISQFDRYSGSRTFSEAAGLSIFIKSFVFLVFAGATPLPQKKRLRATIIAAFAVIFSMGVTQFTYAGLRLLDIVAWMLPLLYMGSLDPNQRIGKRFVLGLLLVGMLGGAATTRNIFSSVDEGASPFIPYKFYWEASN